MATITPTALTPLRASYGSLTVGDDDVPVSCNAGGDTVPMLGDYVILTFATTGTAATITFDSVVLSDQGQDTNVTCVMSATDRTKVVIKNDARFKQQSGNVGNVNLTYTAVTGMTVDAKYLVAN
jgi:hypothetical protein